MYVHDSNNMDGRLVGCASHKALPIDALTLFGLDALSFCSVGSPYDRSGSHPEMITAGISFTLSPPEAAVPLRGTQTVLECTTGRVRAAEKEISLGLLRSQQELTSSRHAP
jgi:hypothetical protein